MDDRYYASIDAGCPNRLRGTSQQTQVGLLYTPPSGSLGAYTSTDLIEGVAIGYAGLQNRSAATIQVGVGARVPNRYWIAGQCTATTFTNDTTDAQSTTAADFPLETASTNNSGFVIASTVKFNTISLRVSTASAGGAAVRSVSYSDSAAPQGWTALSNLFVQDAATGDYATGEQLIVFAAPNDWIATVAALNGVPAGYYAIRVLASTAPTGTAGVAACMEAWRINLATEGLTDNNTWEYSPNKGEMIFPESNGVGVLFSTANIGNRATLHVRTA